MNDTRTVSDRMGWSFPNDLFTALAVVSVLFHACTNDGVSYYFLEFLLY